MKKNIIIRILSLLLALLTAAALPMLLISCDGSENGDDSGDGSGDSVKKLSFASALDYKTLKEMDGKKVTINGYLATSSPADGSFIFLMNMPYQSCPFCKPNTSQLTNTMEVYPKANKKFDYTEQAVKVEGTLMVAKDENTPFTDEYGYEFNFKIVDAEYHVLRDDEISDELALWQKISATDVVVNIYSMYDYVNFCCMWPTYYIDSYMDADGTMHTGWYLWASEAQELITASGAQYNYGYVDGYFDDIIASIRKVDAEAFEDLVKNVEKAEALAEKAIAELLAGNYTYETQYVEKFGTNDDIYTLNIGEELEKEMNALYDEFSLWISSWEL